MKIDGNDKNVTLSGETGMVIARNTRSNVTINLSNSGISVQTVSIEDWNVVEVGGHKFTWSMSAGTTRILSAYPRKANDLKRLLYLLLSENLYFDGLASISSCTSKVFPQDIRGRFVEKRHFSPPVTLPSTTRTVGVSADSLG